jgi:hypothetical protein
MDSKSMTRKEFVTLTFTLLGGAATAAACSSSSSSSGTGGTTGTSTGGTTGTGTCANPLPETQVPDTTGHTHTVTIPASDLNGTSDLTITTSEPMATNGATVDPHTHTVTLTTAELGTLKGGGTVTVGSSTSMSHSHMYMVSCGSATGPNTYGAGGSGGRLGGGGHGGFGGILGGGGHPGLGGNLGIGGH